MTHPDDNLDFLQQIEEEQKDYMGNTMNKELSIEDSIVEKFGVLFGICLEMLGEMPSYKQDIFLEKIRNVTKSEKIESL